MRIAAVNGKLVFVGRALKSVVYANLGRSALHI